MVNFIFTSIQFIKNNTPIDGNVDDKEIYKHVKPAQDFYILDALGTKLYESLGAAVIAKKEHGTPYTTEQQDLLDKIEPALAYWIVYSYLVFGNWKVKNNSIAQSNSDQNQGADMATVGTLNSAMKSRAEYYTSQLKQFLQLNSADYPDYTDGSMPVLPNHRIEYDSGLYFPIQGNPPCANDYSWYWESGQYLQW